MQARWRGVCQKCGDPWEPGDEIKPRFVPAGLVDGKMTYRRAEREYVHKACKPKPKAEPDTRRVDPATGEFLA